MRLNNGVMALATLLISFPWTAMASGLPDVDGDDKVEESPIDLECGVDRRCRLRLFRAELVKQRQNELEAVELMRELDQKRRERLLREVMPVRQLKPFTADLFLTSGAVGGGFMLGWSANPEIRLEIFWNEVNLYSYYEDPVSLPDYESLDGYSSSWSNSLSGQSLGWRLRLSRANAKQDGLAGYLALGTMWLGVSIDTYSYESWLDEEGMWQFNDNSRNEEGEAHAGLVAAGVDLQFRFGFHMALELQYVYPYYVQVRDPESRLPIANRQRFIEKAIDDQSWGVGWMMGWAF